jgi:hypothetical protein
MTSTRLRACAGPVLLTLAACGDASQSVYAPRGTSSPSPSSDAGSTAPLGSTATGGVDEAVVLSSVTNGAYKYSPQFAPVNRVAYASTAAAGIEINVWATSADVGSYAKIAPERSGSNVVLNPGAMIVREVLKNGAVVKLTLMVKGPPGYNPDLGDFCFGVTDPEGVPLIDNGKKLTGKLSQCYGCHIPRKDDGYLFGVSEDARTPPASSGQDAGIASSDAAAPPSTVPPDPTPPPVLVPPPAQPPPAPVEVCGDFYCDANESCATCAADCGRCPTPPPTDVCGDGWCGAQESCATCPFDCGSCEVEGGGEGH